MKKEKETILEKAKRKAHSAKEKVVGFVNENGELIVGGAVLVASTIAGIAFTKNVCNKAKHAAENEEQLKNQILGLMEKGSQWREEDYRENWDIVNGVARGLDLKQGEEYIITAPGTYVGQDELIVSHMVNGTGVYPPDDDCNQETEGE